MGKVLTNTNVDEAKKATPDLKIFGNGDAWKLICKASSQIEGWFKSTKAMEIKGLGCIVQVSTFQQDAINPAVAEALVFVPNIIITEQKDEEGKIIGRTLELNKANKTKEYLKLERS